VGAVKREAIQKLAESMKLHVLNPRKFVPKVPKPKGKKGEKKAEMAVSEAKKEEPKPEVKKEEPKAAASEVKNEPAAQQAPQNPKKQ
jgi:hypothetical protein